MDFVNEIGQGLWRVSNQVFPSNSYLCATDRQGDCVLIDPGTDPEIINAAMGELALKPSRILCTHGHFDHAGSASFFQKRYGSACHLHEADLKTLKGSNFLLMAFRIPFRVEPPSIQAFGELPPDGWRIYPAPGHTPGSCVIQRGRYLFTGDTLYSYGIGLSKLPGENVEQLRQTLVGLWNQLPIDSLVCPGHGNPAPFEEVRRNNRPLQEFLGLEKPSGRGD